MNQAELNKQIRLAYQRAEKSGDTEAMQRLESLYEKYSEPIDNLTASVSRDADLFRSVGLDANKDISKMLDSKPEEIVKQYSMLKDPTVLENIDSWSQDKWRAMAKANGFSNLREFINLLYSAKASYDKQKAWESEEDKLYLPGYGRVNSDNMVTRALGRGQDWIARNFYRNVYEGGKRGKDDLSKQWVADQTLNTAAGLLAPVGGPVTQALIGASLAGANEAAGAYLSDADFDLKQIPIGAALGAFGGRAAGKAGGDIIKSSAQRVGLKPNRSSLEKMIFGVGNTLEDAALDPTREAKTLGKSAEEWLRKNVDAESLDKLNAANISISDKKAAVDKVIAEAKDAPEEVIDWLKSTKETLDNQSIPMDNEWKTFRINDDKEFWRRSVQNDLPTKTNVDTKRKISWLSEYGPDLDKYVIVDGEIGLRSPSMPPLRSPTREEFEEWVKTIPENETFRRSWANNRANDIVRGALKVGSQEYGSNRGRKDSDLEAEVEGIRQRKPGEYEKYLNGEASDLTYSEKMKIDDFLKRGYEE